MTGRKLLLADDSITIQKVVNLTFVDEGIEVISVGDGDAALERALVELPDIILADVNMPGLTGYQVCERIRADARTRNIPVILLSGTFEQFDESEADRVGATAHLTKPFQSIRMLVNQVTDLIGSGGHSALAERVPESEASSFPSDEAKEYVTPANPFDEPVRSQLDSFREDRIASIDQHHETTLETMSETTEADLSIASQRQQPDDIESLYLQSIGEEPGMAVEELPDFGADDEMIETSYSAAQTDNDDLDLDRSYGNEPSVEPIDDVETKSSVDLPHTQRPTAYNTADLAVVDSSQEHHAPTPNRPDETVRLDPAMVDAQMAEVNRRIGSIEQPPPPNPNEQPPIGEDTIRMDSRFDTQGSASYEFDDIDLLDIPSETEVEISTPADSAARGGTKQIVTLSPELIEMIAQRVVEKLSEKY